MLDWRGAIETDFEIRQGTCVSIREAIGDKSFHRIAQIGNSSDKKFAYPFEKRRTRQSRREPVLDPELASIYKPLSNICIGELVRGTSSSTEAKTKTNAKTRDATSNTTDAPSATTVVP